LEKTSKLLIVAATEKEISELQKKLRYVKTVNAQLTTYSNEELEIDILITGVGIPATMYRLTKTLNEFTYDLVLNVGFCGTYSEDLALGDSVSVILDEFADLGMTYPKDNFKTLFEEEFLKPDQKPFKNGKLYTPTQKYIDTELPKVTGITVNNVSGSRKQIKLRKDKFNPDIETMEGAAVAYICLCENISYLQIRTVSNTVEPRNKAFWNIPHAIFNLSETIETIISNINKQLY